MSEQKTAAPKAQKKAKPETVLAQIEPQVRCPHCSHVLLMAIHVENRVKRNVLSCFNDKCKGHQVKYEYPKIQLIIIKDEV